MAVKAQDLTGKKFGLLTVIKLLRVDRGNYVWKCKCECGTIIERKTGHLNRTIQQSCGKKKHGTKHNHAHNDKISPTYSVWKSMKSRCNRQKQTGYENYGGRGIKVCNRWKTFENFLEDMGERPKDKTLDRIDNDGNYCKVNCRWASRKEQSRNKRTNYILTFKGETKCLQDWAEEYNVHKATLRHRIKKGWDMEKALNTKYTGKSNRATTRIQTA